MSVPGAPCAPRPGYGTTVTPQEQTGPCWQQGIPFSSSLSLTWVTYCHLHLQLHFLRRSVPFSSHQPRHRCNVVNPALLGERDNPVWSWLRQFPSGVTSSGCALFYCWVLPPSTCKQVNHRWEGGPFLLHGFFGVKDPLELEKPSGVRSCPANTSR